MKKTSRKSTTVSWDKKLFRLGVYVMPPLLFFSYYPIIQLGGNETMNFELSLPLIWLCLFDVLTFGMMIKEKKLFKGLKGKWLWLLFPLWATLSIVWSLNMVRGLLTVGVLWLLIFAIYSIWEFRGLLADERYKVCFMRWFLGATLFVCGWCIVQCVLDLVGVGQEYSLLCDGCTYHMFGFPHPNGFAIEPQFMGNLLLAPVFLVAWLYANKQKYVSSRSLSLVLVLACLFITIATLFLTFSRGAIYAFGVGMIVMSAWMIINEREKRRNVVKRVAGIWGVTLLAFVAILNIQGMMAELSPTDDTYQSGVAKVINHLSLGMIDLQEGNAGVEPVENIVENPAKNTEKEKAAFDGYVAESTDTRLRLSGAAMQVWQQDFKNVVFGVGLGGAGQALYDNELSPAPKEIVQNQYPSILLEMGLIGMILFALLVFLIVRALLTLNNAVRIVLLSLIIAYGITLCFFSGLPNALQIYLMPVLLSVMLVDYSKVKRKKLVS